MQSVRYERSGAGGHIILCNPPSNLLNVEFYEQLREALLSATSDDLRAVLVRADGPNFCGGGDTAVLGGLTPAQFRLFIVAARDAVFRQIEVSVGSMPIAGACSGWRSGSAARGRRSTRC